MPHPLSWDSMTSSKSTDCCHGVTPFYVYGIQPWSPIHDFVMTERRKKEILTWDSDFGLVIDEALKVVYVKLAALTYSVIPTSGLLNRITKFPDN